MWRACYAARDLKWLNFGIISLWPSLNLSVDSFVISPLTFHRNEQRRWQSFADIALHQIAIHPLEILLA
jgi:hypothetical protein